MQEMIEMYRHRAPQRDQSHSRLLAEIAYLEARLIAVGQTGDCAYEKALARSYRELLALRREQLGIARRDAARAEVPTPISSFLSQSERFLRQGW